MSEQNSDHEAPGVDGANPPSQVHTRTSVEDESSGVGWKRYVRKLKPLLGYLPTGAHESDSEYDGLFSYSVEIHATIIGIAAGAFAATTGNVQAVMGLVAVVLGIGRMQQPQKITEQLKREPWYFLAALGITYLILTRDVPSIVSSMGI